jgi:hypothetical protein
MCFLLARGGHWGHQQFHNQGENCSAWMHSIKTAKTDLPSWRSRRQLKSPPACGQAGIPWVSGRVACGDRDRIGLPMQAATLRLVYNSQGSLLRPCQRCSFMIISPHLRHPLPQRLVFSQDVHCTSYLSIGREHFHFHIAEFFFRIGFQDRT